MSEQEDINITTDPVLIIKRAIENARPLMALEKVKVGSVEYLVPKPITVTASQFRGNVTNIIFYPLWLLLSSKYQYQKYNQPYLFIYLRNEMDN